MSAVGCTYLFTTLVQLTNATFTHIPIGCPSFSKFPNCTYCEYKTFINRDIITYGDSNTTHHFFSNCTLGNIDKDTTNLTSTCQQDNITTSYRLDLRGNSGCIVYVDSSVQNESSAATNYTSVLLDDHVVRIEDPFGITWCTLAIFHPHETVAYNETDDNLPQNCKNITSALEVENGITSFDIDNIFINSSKTRPRISVIIKSSNFSVKCNVRKSTQNFSVGDSHQGRCMPPINKVTFTVKSLVSNGDGSIMNLSVTLFDITSTYQPDAIFYMVGTKTKNIENASNCSVYNNISMTTKPFGEESNVTVSNKNLTVQDGAANTTWSPDNFQNISSTNKTYILTIWKPDVSPKNFSCRLQFEGNDTTFDAYNTSCSGWNISVDESGNIDLRLVNVSWPYPTYIVGALTRKASQFILLSFYNSTPEEDNTTTPAPEITSSINRISTEASNPTKYSTVIPTSYTVTPNPKSSTSYASTGQSFKTTPGEPTLSSTVKEASPTNSTISGTYQTHKSTPPSTSVSPEDNKLTTGSITSTSTHINSENTMANHISHGTSSTYSTTNESSTDAMTNNVMHTTRGIPTTSSSAVKPSLPTKTSILVTTTAISPPKVNPTSTHPPTTINLTPNKHISTTQSFDKTHTFSKPPVVGTKTTTHNVNDPRPTKLFPTRTSPKPTTNKNKATQLPPKQKTDSGFTPTYTATSSVSDGTASVGSTPDKWTMDASDSTTPKKHTPDHPVTHNQEFPRTTTASSTTNQKRPTNKPMGPITRVTVNTGKQDRPHKITTSPPNSKPATTPPKPTEDTNSAMWSALVYVLGGFTASILLVSVVIYSYSPS